MSRETGRIFAISKIPQTDYDTFLAPAGSPKNYEQIAKQGYDFANFTTNPVTNEGFTTATAFPTKSSIQAHDVTQSLTERMTSQAIGRRLLAMLGGYSVQADTPEIGAYTHTFTPLDPQIENDLVSYTYVEKIGEPALAADIVHDLMFPSMKVESGQLNSPSTIDNGAFLEMVTAWRGSGKMLGSGITKQTGSGVNFYNTTEHVELDEAKAEEFFKRTSAVLSLFDEDNYAGTNFLPECDFRGLNFSHNNNLLVNQGYQGCNKLQVAADYGSGAVRGSLPIGNQASELSFMLLVKKAFAQDFNPYLKHREQTVFSLKLNWYGDLFVGATQHQLTFNAPRITANNVVIDSDDTLDRFNIDCNTLAAGQVQPYSFVLVNNVPSYLSL